MKNLVPYFFLAGVLLCYSAAAFLYPGGSEVNPISVGFNAFENYWCDLMQETAINGNANHGYLFAIASLWLLCGWMFLFFRQLSDFLIQSKPMKLSVVVLFALSFVFAGQLFTSYHDLALNLSSIMGFPPLLILILHIIKNTFFKKKLSSYKWMAISCAALLVLNNVIYHLQIGMIALPLLQKITLLIALLWSVSLYQRLKKHKN